MTATPFDDIRNLLAALPPADHAADSRVRALFAKAEKPKASLGRIGSSLDIVGFEAMIDHLAAAELIYVIGSKRAFPVTTYLSLTLSQQGMRNVLVDNVGSTALDQVGCITPRDTVLAVSFSPYNSITPDLVAVAHERKARIVTITDSTFSPLVKLSDTWLEVVEHCRFPCCFDGRLCSGPHEVFKFWRARSSTPSGSPPSARARPVRPGDRAVTCSPLPNRSRSQARYGARSNGRGVQHHKS